MRKKLTVIGVAVAVLSVAVLGILLARPWERGGLWALGMKSAGTPSAIRNFDGPDEDPLQRPVGVLAHDGRIYVADSQRGVIDVFSPGGHHFKSWGRGVLKTPVAIARNPLTGVFYVTDRGLETIMLFGADGTPKGQFTLTIADAGSSGATQTVPWSPVGLDFSPDGYLFVTDVRTRHRLLVLDPDGAFETEAGTSRSAGSVELSFPTAVKVHGNEVWVADSNNMRLRVFDLSGRFVRTVDAPRLPRGLDFAPGRDGEGTVLVADVMSNQVKALDAKTGRSVRTFGTLGAGKSGLSFPNAVATGDGDLVFVADTGNSRVSVWSWTGRQSGLGGAGWWLGLLAVPLLPLLALPFMLRKPRFFITADFVHTLEEVGRSDSLSEVRAKWECLPEDLGELEISYGGRPFMATLEPVLGSEADAKAMRESYHLTEREAAVLSAARGATSLLTDDPSLLRISGRMGITAQNTTAFLSRLDAEKPPPEAEQRA